MHRLPLRVVLFTHDIMLVIKSICFIVIITTTKHGIESKPFISVPSSLFGSTASRENNLLIWSTKFKNKDTTQHSDKRSLSLRHNTTLFSLRAGGETSDETSDEEIGKMIVSDSQSSEDDFNNNNATLNEQRDDVTLEFDNDCNSDNEKDCNNISSETNNNNTTPSLLPYKSYTTIFSKDNDIFGKGRYYSTKTRIKNLLDKWENDDTNNFDKQQINNNDNEIKELQTLMSIIYERARDYIEDLHECKDKVLEKGKVGAIMPHPKKVLHFIAPKIPAIRRSPEITLKISSARVRVDVRAAACALGVIAIITEYYVCLLEEVESKIGQKNRYSIQSEVNAIFESIVTDRRFEQLIECIQCGVDVENVIQEEETEESTIDELLPGEKDEIQEQNTLCSEEEEVEDMKHKIRVIDASKSIWALSIFSSHHDVEQLGGIKCSLFVRALQIQSAHLLKNQLNHFKTGSKQNFSCYTDTKFVKEVHSLLKETVYLMWASNCASEIFQLDNTSTLQTCTFILNQEVKAIWDSMQEQKNEEAVVDDIIERLAEAEEGDTNDAIKMQSNNDESQISCTTDSNEDPSRAGFILDYLSCRDTVVVLDALKGIDKDKKNCICATVLTKLQNNVNMWIHHDLNTLHGSEDNFTAVIIPSDEIRLVDAASILSVDEQQLGIDTMHQRDMMNLDDINEKGNLALSINDLGVALGNTHGSISIPIHKVFQLILLHLDSQGSNGLENVFLYKLLRDSSSHADNLLKSVIAEKLTLMFYDKISHETFSRFNYDTELIVKSLSANELVSLVSSLYSISSVLKLTKHRDVIDEKLVLNILKGSMHHAIESKEDGFSTIHLCRFATVYAESHRTLASSAIEFKGIEALGTIVAKISMEFRHWMNKEQHEQSLDEEYSLPPVAFNDLSALFAALAALNLYPYDLCPALTKLVKHNHPSHSIRDEDLIQCLYTGAKIRTAPRFHHDINNHHLSHMVTSILSSHKQLLNESTLSPLMFSKTIWSLAIHGAKYSNYKIPHFTFEALRTLPHSKNIQMVRKFLNFAVVDNYNVKLDIISSFHCHLVNHLKLIGLIFASKKSLKSDHLMLNLLKIVEEIIPHISADEICSVAACGHIMKQKLEFGGIADDEHMDESIKDSIESIFVSIADKFQSDFSLFSMHQMKILLECYENTTSMFGFIREKADSIVKTLQNENENEELESKLRQDVMCLENRSIESANIGQLAFHHGWVKLKSIKVIPHDTIKKKLMTPCHFP